MIMVPNSRRETGLLIPGIDPYSMCGSFDSIVWHISMWRIYLHIDTGNPFRAGSGVHGALDGITHAHLGPHLLHGAGNGDRFLQRHEGAFSVPLTHTGHDLGGLEMITR